MIVPMKTIEQITNEGIENQVPILQEAGVSFLVQLLKENHAQSFLEIGTAIGRTAILAASLDKNMKVVTIERDPEMARQARENIAQSGYADRICFIEADAREADLPQGPYDCIFIDAAKSQYKRFFKRFAPLLAENGIIVTDNMNFHGMVANPSLTHNRHTKGLIRRLKEYRSFLEDHPEFDTVLYEIGDGIAVSRRKTDTADRTEISSGRKAYAGEQQS